MSSGKPKGSGVTSASFFDLKAELSKKEDEFAKSKAAGKGKASPIVGGIKRDDKKPSMWMKKNKGVADRMARDREMEALSKPTAESARIKLEKKAKIYEQLKRGRTGGLTEKQFDAILVDFDEKSRELDYYSSDSDDVDESLTVPKDSYEESVDDPIVEYQDEFGRTRTARRSEVPREALIQVESHKEEQG
ncbi:hypothetical protein FRC03_006723 [Tulasnella sp. 419]|nr:hypothetical protein FRC03_006723 [Tulasnella sp. 419]